MLGKQKFARGAAARFAPLRFSIICTALALSAPSATAQTASTHNVAQFLARADKLMQLGPVGLAAPDALRLRNEMIDVARRYKSRNDAQRKAGQARTSCPPNSGDLAPEVWLQHLRSYPAAQRPRIAIERAFDDFMVRHYPCA